MRFQKKVFFSSFLISALLLMALAWFVQELLRSALENQYRERYQSLSQVIGDTLQQMEATTAKISGGSAQMLYSLTSNGKLPSEAELKKIRTMLGISQMVITNKEGRLIRDTETPPEQRNQTIFDFCPGYRSLLTDPPRIETTPILPSYPSGQAYIFSMMANAARNGIVEAGLHVSFIVDTLKKALKSDGNILSIGLYTPKGVPLGFIAKDSTEPESLPLQLNDYSIGNRIIENDRLAIVTRVPALVETCCECVKKQLTHADGQYYYLLRTQVTLSPLLDSIRAIRKTALLILVFALLLGLALSHWISSLLVRRLNLFREGVRKVVESGDLSQSLQIPGGDEISDLAASFDEMTAQLSRSQKEAIQAEKNRTIASVAKQVAHDIRSPLAALKAAIHSVAEGNEAERKLIRSAADRIHEIAENLLARSREGAPPSGLNQAAPPISLLEILEGAMKEKRIELGPTSEAQMEFRPEQEASGLFATISPSELRRVLSNLLNNAIEAIAKDGHVTLSLAAAGPRALIRIQDNGKGIPEEILPLLMQQGRTYGKTSGSGLGLAHARETIEGCGGVIRISSEKGKGTVLEIELPLKQPPPWHVDQILIQPEQTIVIIDDDKSMHQAWKSRLESAELDKPRLIHCFGTDELQKQQKQLSNELPDKVLYLVDQQITGSEETGIAAISRLGIEKQSILVTSHADDPLLLERCRELGLRVLPKTLTAYVPVRRKR